MPNKRLDRGVSGSGFKVGIVRGDYWGDLGLDLGRDRARIEPGNNIATLVNYTCIDPK